MVSPYFYGVTVFPYFVTECHHVVPRLVEWYGGDDREEAGIVTSSFNFLTRIVDEYLT
jgi:hypothetical protein